MKVEFFVAGIPATQGSKKGFIVKRRDTGKQRVVLADDNPRNKPWRADVREAALSAYQGAPMEGPIIFEVSFFLPRPKGHFGTRGLRPSAPACPTTKPDLSKLARSVEDALKGILWRDDSQVVESNIRKEYTQGETPGAYIFIQSTGI